MPSLPMPPSETASDSTAGVGHAMTNEIASVGDQLQAFIRDPSVDGAVGIVGPALLDLAQALLGLAALVVVTLLVARWARRITHASLGRLHVEDTPRIFLSTVAKYLVWVLAVNRALADAAITIPFPQRDLHVRPGSRLRIEPARSRSHDPSGTAGDTHDPVAPVADDADLEREEVASGDRR